MALIGQYPQGLLGRQYDDARRWNDEAMRQQMASYAQANMLAGLSPDTRPDETLLLLLDDPS